MAFSARIVADSVSPRGVRLTTMLCTYPAAFHDHLLTHRMLSRNSSSRRAIPTLVATASIEGEPFVPARFGRACSGMASLEYLPTNSPEDAQARQIVRSLCERSLEAARALKALGIHKQHVNYLLTPFAWITTVFTATDWKNFYAQRCHPDAQPEVRTIAETMRDAQAASAPVALDYGAWHLPFVEDSDWSFLHSSDCQELRWEPEVRNRPRPLSAVLWLVSAGRCARTSYLGLRGTPDPAADARLALRLLRARPMHASPFEHQAMPHPRRPPGNFRGWMQHRHLYTTESVKE